MAGKKAKQGVSQREASLYFGVDLSTILDWARKGWVARFDDRSIDIEGTKKLLEANRSPRGGVINRTTKAGVTTTTTIDGAEESPIGKTTLTEARTRREIALAKKAELEVARIRGELVPRAEAEAAYMEVIAALKANLEAIPQRVAPALVGLKDMRAIQGIVRREIETAMRGLSDDPPEIQDDTILLDHDAGA